MLVSGSVAFIAMTMKSRCQLVPPVSQFVHGSRRCPRFTSGQEQKQQELSRS
jgi:hypothetical protein